MASRTHLLTEETYEYLRAVSLREPDVLRELSAETASMPDAVMQTSQEQAQFMMLLVQLMGVRRALEIGVFTGYSALAVALALPSDGRLVACDTNADWAAVARRYWRKAGVGGKIELHLRPAAETISELLAKGQAESFDFVFIDADKTSYDLYYERSLQLVRRGGLIALDNMLWFGRVADATQTDPDTVALRALNEKLLRDDRIFLSMLPIGDGLTLARKN